MGSCQVGLNRPAAAIESYKQAIKILLAELYEHREATDNKYISAFADLPYGVQMLIGIDKENVV